MNKAKVKDILGTLFQIILVAAVIMGGLMFVQNSLNKARVSSDNEEATAVTSASDKGDDSAASGTGSYSIKVNKAKNAVIVYQKNDEGDDIAVKVMRCSLGPDTPKGSFELMESYSWISAEEGCWNRYSSRFTEQYWFESEDYTAQYSSYVSADSYNSIGEKTEEGGCIKLTVGDAKWIYENCPSGTKVEIVKGSKDDELPLEFDEFMEIPSYAGWDPTDPDAANPWNNIADGTIAAYTGIVYVEQGSDVNYLANVIAFDTDGTNVTKNLKYDEFDANKLGTYTVEYSYKCSDGTKMKSQVTYEVMDTEGPVLYLTSDKESDFTLLIDKEEVEELNTDEFKETVIKKMKKLVKAVDGEGEIQSSSIVVILPDELKLGNNQIKYSVSDDYGNTSYLTVSLKITTGSDEEDESLMETIGETEETSEEETTVQNSDVTNTQATQGTTRKNTDSTTKSTTKNTATTKKNETTTFKPPYATKGTTQNSSVNEDETTDNESASDKINEGEQSAGD